MTSAVPLDMRLLPATVGTWWVCLVAIHTDAGGPAHLNLAGWLLAVIAVSGAAAGLWRPRRQARHRSPAVGWLRLTFAIGALLSVLAGGVAVGKVASREQALATLHESLGRGALPVSIQITSDAKNGVLGWGVNARLLSVHSHARFIPVNVPAYAMKAESTWRAGMRVTAQATLSPSDEQRVFLRISRVERVEDPRGLSNIIDRLRQGIRTVSQALQPQARGLIPGVAIGDDRRLPIELDEAMRTTSLKHLTAVSGAHVSVVTGTLLLITARAPTWLRATIAGAVLLAMVGVVLPTPSALRAVGMGLITLAALLTRRPRTGVPILCATVIVLLAVDPWLATSVGFALSVSATLGILMWSAALARRFGGGALAHLLAVPVAAQAWCAPILLTLQEGIAGYAIPANMLAVPALAPATVLGLFAAVVSLVSPPLATVLTAIASFFTGWIAAVALFFARLPGATIPWWSGRFGIVLLVTLTVALAALIYKFPNTDVGRTWEA